MPDRDHISVQQLMPQDVEAACTVLIASITQLCTTDHKNDPETITAWTANKTPANLRRWIEDDRVCLLTAKRGDVIAGVAGYLTTGDVILNYVSPSYRFQGISELLLSRIEKDFVQAGVRQARLSSTITAESFYLARGWRAEGPVEYSHGMPGQPMIKQFNLEPPPPAQPV